MARRSQVARKKHQVAAPPRPHADMADQLASNVRQLMSLERYEVAVELLVQLQGIDPGHAEGLLLQAELELKTDQREKAFHSLLAASYQLSDHPRVYELLAQLHTRGGQDRAAISALLRCVHLRPDNENHMLRLAALYNSAELFDQADYWRGRALCVKPFDCRSPVQESERKLRVLQLMTAESTRWGINRKTFQTHLSEGHNNLGGLIDNQKVELWRLFVDVMCKAPEVARKLPKFDVVYNGITDAERCEEALKHAQVLCDRLSLPVINPPKAVLAASREGNYARFKDHPGIIFPKSVKLEVTQDKAKDIVERMLAEEGFDLPVIIRLAGFQGGKFMHKVESLEQHDFSDLDAELEKQPQTVYVIQYYDVSYIDERTPDVRLYPKYRAFMVGKKLYPVHMFTSDCYNVHLKVSEHVMHQHKWLIDQERDFCENPERHLGKQAWQTLRDVMQASGLEYNGIDFALSTDPKSKGKIVVFELNPAMRNWVAQLPEGDHVQQAWHTITKAAHRLFCDKASVEAWDFNLPKGLPPKLKDDDILTLRLHIQGTVQGVGYRKWFASQLAERDIPGWVRNLKGGSVEAVIHGKLADLQALCDEVPKGPEASNVTGLNVTQWEGEVPEGVQILQTAG